MTENTRGIHTREGSDRIAQLSLRAYTLCLLITTACIVYVLAYSAYSSSVTLIAEVARRKSAASTTWEDTQAVFVVFGCFRICIHFAYLLPFLHSVGHTKHTACISGFACAVQYAGGGSRGGNHQYAVDSSYTDYARNITPQPKNVRIHSDIHFVQARLSRALARSRYCRSISN